MRCLLILATAGSIFGQSFSFEPPVPAQGQVLKVRGDGNTQSASLNGRTVRLYPQPEGYSLGLLPVAVLAKPGAYSLEWLDAAGKPLHTASVRVADAHYAKQNVVLTKALSQLKSTSDERETVGNFLKQTSAERYWREPLTVPIPGCITSPFGVTRLHNGKPTGDFHAGLDQRGALGSPIHPVASGTVKISKLFTLRGGTVAIDHGQGLESIYLHMSQIAAKEGEQVKPGDVIGYVGSTGRSTGPHLHWTLYANGQPVNPLQWVHLSSCPATGPARKRAPARRVSP